MGWLGDILAIPASSMSSSSWSSPAGGPHKAGEAGLRWRESLQQQQKKTQAQTQTTTNKKGDGVGDGDDDDDDDDDIIYILCVCALQCHDIVCVISLHEQS